MLNYSNFYEDAQSLRINKLLPDLKTCIDEKLASNRFGDRFKWFDALHALPRVHDSRYDFTKDVISIDADLEPSQISLESIFKILMPWRKGPYRINEVFIDTEWRSDFKWKRIQEKIAPLHGRTILDVGCGNGYHLFRMLGDKARFALGIDPMLFYICQFFAIQHFLPRLPLTVLPLTLDDFPNDVSIFDTVFSMGVLYHRRSPIDHIQQLKNCLRPGGQLILETLVVDGQQHCLLPQDRYAKMRNVWFLPSTDVLETMLERLNFTDIETISVDQTTTEEQRATNWMQYESLKDFLDPKNPKLTIEGYQAPTRAVVIATKR
ncbi:MAG: tRNA 5-methoxyuridine(34)/uridine 5-oxyacetic acid(34) synthase CmoB [Pseudomonadota bacterium]